MKSARTFFFPLALAAIFSRAQTAPRISPAAAMQLMVRQPVADVSAPENISATAEFDPPAVRPGEKTFYRVAVGATENSIAWPGEISAPPELRFGAAARGQLMQPDGVPFQPHTEFVYEVQASAAGRFVVSNFLVSAGGRSVEIPAAGIDVETNAAAQPLRKLSLEVSATNLFFGQPFRVRVISPATPGNQIEALRDVQFNGGGFLTDKLATRQSIETVNRDGQLKPAFIYETVATPLAAGTLAISAQGFTAGGQFSGPVAISGQVAIPGGPPRFILLASDEVRLNVRPLPAENEPPGFTGALGKFLADAPQLSTNRVRVGEPLRLKFGFHGEGNLARFVPPAAPRSREWQIIAGKPDENIFTLIPLTDEATGTPAIPFSAFDPATENYYDLTIPALPVTVAGDGLPTQVAAWNADENNAVQLRLGAPARRPGKSVASLEPPQFRGWLVCAQMLPVIFFIALWRWDERRRFWEAHPEIARRRKAKRELRREKIKLQNAFIAGDADGFAAHAAAAMRIAVAPHFPAAARALVGGDVLTPFEPEEQRGKTGEVVRKIFAAADAQFASRRPPPPDLFALKADVETVLQKLEEKL